MGERKRLSSRTKGKEEKELVEGTSSHATPEGIIVTSPQRRGSYRENNELIGHVFEAGANRYAQIVTYNTSMEAIKTTRASTMTHMC